MNNEKRRTSSPPEAHKTVAKTSTNSLASFFFSNSLFKSNKKPPVIPESPNKTKFYENSTSQSSFSSNKFDLITSKLLNLKSSTSRCSTDTSHQQAQKKPTPYSLHSSSSSLSNVAAGSDTHSIRSNHSSQNLNSFFSSNNNSSMSSSVSVDLKMPNSVLIFENRPRLVYFLLI